MFILDPEWRGAVAPQYKNTAFMTHDGSGGKFSSDKWKLPATNENAVREILGLTNRLFTQPYGDYLSGTYNSNGDFDLSPSNNFLALNVDDKLNVINNNILPLVNQSSNIPNFTQSRRALIDQLTANEDSLVWSADQGKVIKFDKGPAPVK